MSEKKELSAKYSPSEVENKWYEWWQEHKCFHSEPDDREPYTIVIPPPNVTGILHMGHVLNNTLNDVLIRKARMDGKNACWVPGTDHASIATESKVVARLKGMGISKDDLTRDEFMKYAWEWKEEHGGIILQQLRKLGASCDWDRTRFTMDPDLSAAVIATFCHFYKKGLIYRGVRMVNWDPVALTAISDDEVIHKDTKSHFYHLRYYISDGQGNPTDKYLVIATTRPETIMADAAICVNPADERHFWLKGKKVIIPLINKEIPVIEDEYVEMDFGTGCLKVTPAHDAHDYEIGLRHNLPVIDIIDDHGRLNEKAQILVGEDRFAARKKIVGLLEEAGCLEKIEDYTSPVGYSERTDAVIEPKLSAQWFLKMEDLAAKALDEVESGNIKFIPDKYRNIYRHWMENAHDWCISRQLWWGQRIPAYYLPDGQVVVEETPEMALEAARKINPALTAADLRQDDDVLDTWFSSWLWPISVFDPQMPGHPDHKPNRDLAYYYPTNDLVTAPDIIFFWVARMIMAGGEFMDKKPFSNVYFTGIVRDKLGRKMSKTLGNSPDPLVLIEKYGADAVRIGMLLCSSAGNDIFYDESQIEQGRNFCNKIWNSFRLVQGWSVDESLQQSDVNSLSVKWFENKMNQAITIVEDHYAKFRISDALMAIYKLFWDDYCAWYLEAVKPAYGQAIDRATYDATCIFFEKLLKMIHPVMPFISEELWQSMAERPEGATIMFEKTPQAGPVDEDFITAFGMAQEVINTVRGTRQQKNISPKEELQVLFKGDFPMNMTPVVRKLGNVSSIGLTDDFGDTSEGVSALVRTVEMFIPLAGMVNVEEEIRKIEGELEHQRSFLESVRKKLGNESFVAHAPEKVVAMERKKEADSLAKIEAYEKALESLKNR
ncbi:MAG: valine--tRNA ligase [Bacteroidales bacterium]|uniref:valine--tRNA ligase n=3 Tax=Candidatus Cryptobacteroides sp. TaxID=2952915 RepID=UPI002A74A3DD|nr:valine--tRNA ligase [Candidatus Cryptobacteroides sp.]MDD5914878.1 valine--tRNA ligase [Bacteroidales bacterium]MDD7135509.1 valine--tRNA ligase [Bacteroidales bacterium]MDD7234835.1 valine--tRNA ligase [Bacteroidales bacterium]MDY2702549.1 valine--tRNA ligase [Candidatus Cryptobacteroides sp.]MDY3879249.1 valine--tRNA ligase [Candidatus Cryptobacteroides sp.]